MTDISSISELKELIRSHPLVDNHAHNILRSGQLKSADFLTSTTEATGDALGDNHRSLAHIRAARQLRSLYDLPPDADWATTLGKRTELIERDPKSLMRKCFAGTQTILIDDGLDSGSNIEPYGWHDQFTLSPCKRIVRTETVAADILSNLNQQGKLPVGVAIADEEACSLTWVTFIAEFEQAVLASLGDPEVVGFKSVICYRTGLDIQVGRDIEVSEAGLRSFRKHFLPDCNARNFRVDAKGMNDALVISTCKLIADFDKQKGTAKPIQFHTALGDNDISLLESNPAYLQLLIDTYPSVPVGQEKIVRQALEVTPTSKILWSTDGHHFPKTYWLANVQGRAALEKVLLDYVEHEDLTVGQAARAAKDILFENSNKLYGLNLKAGAEQKSVHLPERSIDGNSRDLLAIAAPTPLPLVKELSSDPSTHATKHISELFARDVELECVIVQWFDLLGTLRSRVMPVAAFDKLVQCADKIGISTGNLGTTQNDCMLTVCNPVGQILVKPDLSSLRPLPSVSCPVGCIATVMSGFDDEDGQPLALCPRSRLQQYVGAYEERHGMHLLVGFEIEVTFCRRRQHVEANGDRFEPLDTNHAWGSLTGTQLINTFPLMTSIASALQAIGIPLQQFHSEAGARQYEFVLPPLPPVKAVDTLVQTKHCIQLLAAERGLRATCHPMPSPGIGTAAHAHISMNATAGERSIGKLKSLEASFLAGVLRSLRALCAFTMPQPESYWRVAEDSWTGETWVAWGTQNREIPVRKVGTTDGETGRGSRWEVRCLDGMVNPYLALSAVLGTGLAGIEAKLELKMADCSKNPAKLSNNELQELGAVDKLPRSLNEAFEALTRDELARDALGEELIQHYLELKKAEKSMLGEMSGTDRRVWLIERY
ncbi:glutamine synthetase/guanido kinase [Teratosphaeria nubilosa]|uniref:Glutamine synthetase n=1 Tax=Teratosphaeria nubilosa TaxID=161662 RepID=A0A6G1L974_9PEZI|nr:glutamine synthetase/guanido kinase [Teratosphaeria nubilosa]